MDFRSFLVWPHAPSRVSFKIRPGCSELYPVRSWKHSGMNSTWILWPTCSTAGLFSEWKSFLLIPSLNLSYFSLYCCKEADFTLQQLSQRPWQAAVRLHPGHPFCRLKNVAPSTSPSRANAPGPNHLCGTPLNWLQFIDLFLVQGQGQNCMHCLNVG